MGGPGSGPTAKSVRLHHGEPLVPTAHASKGAPLSWPIPDEKSLHPIAFNWYNSLKVSGQATFYEQSDVALAVHAAELLTLAYAKQNAALFGQFQVLADGLLSTAAARKRMRVDLDIANPVEPPSVAKVEKYKVIAGQAAG